MLHLHYIDLFFVSGLIVLLAMTSWKLRLGLEKSLIIAAIRNASQLLLIGYILTFIFHTENLLLLAVIALIMLSIAGYEINARQKHRLAHGLSFMLGSGALMVSSFSMVLFSLWIIIQPTPWYQPQYAIPLLGMLLGNTMNAISLAMDKLIQSVYQQRLIIEQKLMLGYSATNAIADIRVESIRTGMIPIINSMAIAGVVSLPGMMTGQILSGTVPVEAVKYQIMIFFLIAAGSGFGIIFAVTLLVKRLFDARQRLNLEIIAT